MNVEMSALNYQSGLIHLDFKIVKDNRHFYEYAYYLYQNGQLIERFWYQPCLGEITIKVTPVYSGAYQIRLFVRKDTTIIFNQLSSMLLVDSTEKAVVETTFKNEKVFFNDIPVKYWFRTAKTDSDYLIISFSGLHSTEFQGGAPVYNHISTLAPVDCHQLFILDSYKNQFCYYVGLGGSYEYERTVIALITTYANTYRITPENIIVTGSSKGGSAALYYSLKYRFGKAIIGAPQLYIANYLKRRATSESMNLRFQRLLGQDEKQGISFWNQLIFNQVALTKQFPELFFHVGTGDFHYSEHLRPLLKKLDEKSVNYELDLANYTEHSDTGLYFSPFLLGKVQTIITRKGGRK